MSCVFGPIPSRRLGRSLGIDPLRSKTCNWNCVYCQLGRTTTFSNERRVAVPTAQLRAELSASLSEQAADGVDCISFVGSGETTLAANLGEMVAAVKETTAIPVAVLTNGSLLHQRDVQADLAGADAVLVSLDAGSPEVFRQVARPLPSLTFDRHVDGLAAFRQVYAGQLWLQVMLVRGLNDSPAALADIAAAIERVEPDTVHVSVPSRPPAEAWVEEPDPDVVLQAERMLGEHVRVARAAPLLVVTGGDPLSSLEEMVRRHPVAEEDILAALERSHPGESQQLLADLGRSERARVVVRGGHRYWTASPGRYVEE